MLAVIGAYIAYVAAFLCNVSRPIIRAFDHVGPAVMAALVVTTLRDSISWIDAGPIKFLTLAVMAGVTLWRKKLLIRLFAALVVFFACDNLIELA